MVDWKWISDIVSQTQTIFGLAFLIAATVYGYSGSLIIAVICAILTVVILVIADLNRRLNIIENKLKIPRDRGKEKVKIRLKGYVNYAAIMIFLIILLIILIVLSKGRPLI